MVKFVIHSTFDVTLKEIFAFKTTKFPPTIMDKSLGTNLHLWCFFTRAKQIHLHLFSPSNFEKFNWALKNSCQRFLLRMQKERSLSVTRKRANVSLYENISNFKTHLRARGYSHNLIEKIISEVKLLNGSQVYNKLPKYKRKFCL